MLWQCHQHSSRDQEHLKAAHGQCEKACEEVTIHENHHLAIVTNQDHDHVVLMRKTYQAAWDQIKGEATRGVGNCKRKLVFKIKMCINLGERILLQIKELGEDFKCQQLGQPDQSKLALFFTWRKLIRTLPTCEISKKEST